MRVELEHAARAPPGSVVWIDVELRGMVAGAAQQERAPAWFRRIGTVQNHYSTVPQPGGKRRCDARAHAGATQGVYDSVAQRIIALLEEGIVPWRKPWVAYGPINYVSRKPYRGINALVLDTGEYLTFKQAESCGGRVKKGAKALPVIYWQPPSVQQASEDEEAEEIHRGFVLQRHRVFALDDCTGIPSKLTIPDLPEHQPIAAAQAVIDGYADGPTIVSALSNKARYLEVADQIQMPLPGQFETPEAYYNTLFHEAAHSTGHPTRLGRLGGEGTERHGTDGYSKEELIAEIGAAMLCSHVGIAQRTIQNSASYVQGWLARLRDDRTLIVSAASKAQKAADWIVDHAVGTVV
jgi:antirestriction protein ArdC